MSLVMQGTWTVSVKSKNAAFPQRFTIAGASTGNGTHVVSTSTPSVTVTGSNWSITIEAQDGSVWKPSVMRFKTPVLSGALIKVDIESNDTGADQDFDDLILTCTMPNSGSDFVIFGHAKAYSGLCIFNPCFRFHLVIDSFAQLSQALKNPISRAALERLYPEIVLPRPKNPPDPGPMRTFTPLMLPTPRSPTLPSRAFQVTETRGEVSTRRIVLGKNLPARRLDDALIYKLGVLADGFRAQLLLCKITTLGNYGLRFQEYDRTAAELSGGAYTGTGDREDLGVTATDPFGNYVFRFSRTVSDIIEEGLNDVAVGEDATVQALPDIIAQVLGAGLIPAAETGCFFNVQTLQRIDICVPDINIVLPTTCVDGKILTFIGKISMTSALNSLDSTGRITAHSTAGSAPTIDCGVWWRNLDLWGCFGNPTIARYTVRWRPLGSGPDAWQPHLAEERREIGGGLSKKIGPFFDLNLAVPLDPVPGAGKVLHGSYLNAEIDPTIVQPGAFLKATFHAGGLTAGSYQVRIDCYDAAGDFLKGESHTLFIDNSSPAVVISDILLAGVPVIISGTGCTLQTLTPAELSANLDVRFKVDHANGAILDYAVGISRCNEGSGYPVTHVAGSGQPSFTWVHDNSVDCETAPNFRRGTIEDPDNDGTGFVTTTLAPVNPWLGATEAFTILRVSVGYNWRATDGYANATGASVGPLVWGIQK
jgi:hypothetical protein